MAHPNPRRFVTEIPGVGGAPRGRIAEKFCGILQKFVERYSLPEVEDALAKILLDASSDRADRVTAIGLVGDRGLAEHIPTLRQLLQDNPNDSITVAALRRLDRRLVAAKKEKLE